jgi:hypothetical protein
MARKIDMQYATRPVWHATSASTIVTTIATTCYEDFSSSLHHVAMSVCAIHSRNKSQETNPKVVVVSDHDCHFITVTATAWARQ